MGDSRYRERVDNVRVAPPESARPRALEFLRRKSYHVPASTGGQYGAVKPVIVAAYHVARNVCIL